MELKMITLTPEINRGIDLKAALPIVDRYEVFMEAVDTNIGELDLINLSDHPICMDFGFYGGVHGSFIDDYMKVLCDVVTDEEHPSLSVVLKTLKGGYHLEKASADFEPCKDSDHLERYNAIIRWLLKKRGYDMNYSIGLELLPNPLSEFAEGTVNFMHPVWDHVDYEIPAGAQYWDLFQMVIHMASSYGSPAQLILKDFVLVSDTGGVPLYTVEFEDSTVYH